MKTLAALVVGVAVVGVAASAAAQELPRAMRLEVKGDACVTSESLREALSVALRSDPIDPSAGPRLFVEVLAGASLGRARWRVIGAEGAALRERTVTITGGCGMLLRELALSIAVAYESSAPAPPAVGCDAVCLAKIRAEVRAELCRENPRSCNVDGVIPVLLAGGALSLGLTADPGGGAWLGGEVRVGEVFSAGMEARVLFPSRAVQEPSNEPFELTAVTFALVPCARWKVLLGCAFADIGMLIGGGVTVPSGIPVLATFGVGPRVAVHVPFAKRFGFRAFADLRFAPVPSRAIFASGGRWESSVASGLIGVGFTFE